MSEHFDPNGFYQVRGKVLNETGVSPELVEPSRLMAGLMVTESDLEAALDRVCSQSDWNLSQSELGAAKSDFINQAFGNLLNEELGDYDFIREQITETLFEVVEARFQSFIACGDEDSCR